MTDTELLKRALDHLDHAKFCLHWAKSICTCDYDQLRSDLLGRIREQEQGGVKTLDLDCPTCGHVHYIPFSDGEGVPAPTVAVASPLPVATPTVRYAAAAALCGPKTMRDWTTDYAGNWPEDSPHENGNYFNECRRCKSVFVGYKRRTVCKICAGGYVPDPPTSETK